MVNTYRINLIWADESSLTRVEAEGVPIREMKAQISRMIERNKVPATATLHVEYESTRKIYFRGLLSSLPSFAAVANQTTNLEGK
jgi:hypothetical protein